jgi:hypothetical protein
MPTVIRRLALLALLAAPAAAQSTIPDRLTDKEFWDFVSANSESGGFFRSDNFLSNEMGFLHPIPELKRIVKPGGVYFGVGPEQNFTYISALQPRIAVLFDIRRQMTVHQLMYKAIFELSPDRADFLARLFSRPRPANLDTTTGPVQLFASFIEAKPDTAAYRRNRIAIWDQLRKVHGFALSPDDSSSFEYVYSAFFEAGPLINYNFRPGNGMVILSGDRVALRPGRGFGYGGQMANFAEIQAATDANGNMLAFLATESAYRYMRDLERRNMVVPVTGNFAGPTAIRQVGQWVRAHNATVTTFHLSNVEQYLFQSPDDWRKWFENVGTLPLDSTSMFIRSGRGGTSQGVIGLASMIASMQDQLKLFRDGKINTYFDVLSTSR